MSAIGKDRLDLKLLGAFEAGLSHGLTPQGQGPDQESARSSGLPCATVLSRPPAPQARRPPLGGDERGTGPDRPHPDPLRASQGAAPHGYRTVSCSMSRTSLSSRLLSGWTLRHLSGKARLSLSLGRPPSTRGPAPKNHSAVPAAPAGVYAAEVGGGSQGGGRRRWGSADGRA